MQADSQRDLRLLFASALYCRLCQNGRLSRSSTRMVGGTASTCWHRARMTRRISSCTQRRRIGISAARSNAGNRLRGGVRRQGAPSRGDEIKTVDSAPTRRTGRTRRISVQQEGGRGMTRSLPPIHHRESRVGRRERRDRLYAAASSVWPLGAAGWTALP